jgi:diacylglycerol O-acyltransferase
VRRLIGERAARIPKLRALVRWERFGGASWVPLADFDVAPHVTHVVLDGMPEVQLLTEVASRAVMPLPRDRPLWRLELISGLSGGRVGVLLVLHHAVADGLAALAISRRLLNDGEPDDAPRERPHRPTERPRASLLGALSGLLRRARAMWRELSVLAPITRLARPLGPTRRLVVVRASLEEVRAAGRREEATVNDVVLAAVAAGLRDRLRAWGDDPEQLTLRASMPMAVSGRGTNEVDITVLPLPLAGDDAVSRLRAIAAITRSRKQARSSGRTASVAMPSVPPFVARFFVRWLRRAGAKRVNLYVTNVPGPPEALRFGGARVLSVVPIPPLVAGVPLGVAVVSYAGELIVALHGDGTLEDLDRMGAAVAAGLEELVRPRA